MAYENVGDEAFDSPSGNAVVNAFKAAAAEGTGGLLDSIPEPAIAAAFEQVWRQWSASRKWSSSLLVRISRG